MSPGAHTGNSSAVCGPVRSEERALCVAVHGGEKINGYVVASGSAADFAGLGKSKDETVAHGGQKHACRVPRGVCEEQGSGERASWSQD